jgi:hypothetical protein
MPKDKNQLESVPENHFTSTLFTHEWITYDSKKNEVIFSDEAKWELQKLIDSIQAGFPIEEENHETIDESVSVKNITETTIANVTDAMFVAGKWRKAIKKFLASIDMLLQWKKKWWKLKETEKKVEKKVEKYKDNLFAHIILQYTEDWEIKPLREAPIIVRPWEKITVMLWSLQTRLRFAHIKK